MKSFSNHTGLREFQSHSSRLHPLIIVMILLCLPVTNLLADIVFFKDGRVSIGSIVDQSPDKVRLRTPTEIVVIQKKDILRISFDKEEEATFTKKLEEQKKKEEEAKALEEKIVEMEKDMSTLKSREEKRQAQAKKFDDAFWRSAVLPGWGQYYRGETRKGIWIGAASGILFLNLIRAHGEFTTLDNEYKSSVSRSVTLVAVRDASFTTSNFIQTNGIRNRRATAASEANLAVGLLLGVYFYNLVDAWMIPPYLQVQKQSQPSTISYSINTTREYDVYSQKSNEALVFSMRYSF